MGGAGNHGGIKSEKKSSEGGDSGTEEDQGVEFQDEPFEIALFIGVEQ